MGIRRFDVGVAAGAVKLLHHISKGKRLAEHKNGGHLWNIKAKTKSGCGCNDTFARSAIPPFPRSGLPLGHGQVAVVGWPSGYGTGLLERGERPEIDNCFAVFDILQWAHKFRGLVQLVP